MAAGAPGVESDVSLPSLTYQAGPACSLRSRQPPTPIISLNAFQSGNALSAACTETSAAAVADVALERALQLGRPSVVGRVVVQHHDLILPEVRLECGEARACRRRRHHVDVEQPGLVQHLLHHRRRQLPLVIRPAALAVEEHDTRVGVAAAAPRRPLGLTRINDSAPEHERADSDDSAYFIAPPFPHPEQQFHRQLIEALVAKPLLGERRAIEV